MTEGARISLERSSSELRIKKRGETVQLRRAHISGSVGKKDRHSKVCTSKGPRDRRVRLSATTAIQFYDVQDRLGYDRPSKAVDWLMEKAKTAIDALAELPTQGEQSLQNSHLCNEHLETVNQQDLNENPIYGSGLFQIPLSIAPSSVHFQNSPAEPNLEEISHTQYPYLSLQSLQEPILGHHRSAVPSAYQTINSASSPLVFDAAYAQWPRSLPVEMSQSQKMMDWNSDMGNGIRGLVFDSLPLPLQEPVLRQNQIFSEREPLQSIHSALISTWMNPPPVSTTKNEHTMIAPNESPGIASASIPADIHGEDGEQNPICNSQLSATYC